MSSSETRAPCPFCAEPILTTAIKCRFCASCYQTAGARRRRPPRHHSRGRWRQPRRLPLRRPVREPGPPLERLSTPPPAAGVTASRRLPIPRAAWARVSAGSCSSRSSLDGFRSSGRSSPVSWAARSRVASSNGLMARRDPFAAVRNLLVYLAGTLRGIPVLGSLVATRSAVPLPSPG